MKINALIIGALGISLGILVYPQLSTRPVAASKRVKPSQKLTSAQIALGEEYRREWQKASDAFVQGDTTTTRRFYETQQRLASQKKGFESWETMPVVDYDVPLAACDLAEGHPDLALERYQKVISRRPDQLSPLSGRLFYASYLSSKPNELEEVISAVENATFRNPLFLKERKVEAWEPIDTRTLTLMQMARQLGEDRNRAGTEAAIALANISSGNHPAVLFLHLDLLKRCFHDLVLYRSLGSKVTDADVKSVPALRSDRHSAKSLMEYEQLYPTAWPKVLGREKARLNQEKKSAVLYTFAYELPSTNPTRLVP